VERARFHKKRRIENAFLLTRRRISSQSEDWETISARHKNHSLSPSTTYFPFAAKCIRPGTRLSLEDARRLVNGYVEQCNNVHRNSTIGYITPKDMLAGHQQEIQAKRARKFEAGREQRKNRRQRAA
jgi:hypothetical protein